MSHSVTWLGACPQLGVFVSSAHTYLCLFAAIPCVPLLQFLAFSTTVTRALWFPGFGRSQSTQIQCLEAALYPNTSRSRLARALGHRARRLNTEQASVMGGCSWPWGCGLCGCWLVLGLLLFQKWLILWYYLDSFRRHPSVDWDATGWYKMIYFFQSISWWQ